ncbi:MAG: DUF3373 family protein [Candidatus Krumholzibacteriota bacterium]
MKKTMLSLLTLIALLAIATGAIAEKDTDAKIKALEKRLQKLELKSNKDRIQWTGDLRVEAHSTTGEVDAYIDGMRMQALTYGAMFYTDSNFNPGYIPGDPFGPNDIDMFIGQNYANFQVFRGMNGFPEVKDWVQQMMATNPNMGAMMNAFAMDAYREGFKTDNSILYTTRLRLNMAAKVAKNIDFSGRMSMYKPWGASTQTGVFNGQANTLNTDANWPGTAGDATLKVDRAYFTWKKIGGAPVYLSLGRRPSTDGPPLHYRNDEMRAGTPMGTIIDMQFDGATLGYNFSDKTTVRACYGLGYESQYGNGSLDKDAALKDAHFFGFNIDAWNTKEMQIQTTIARAFDITDGFAGNIIMPNDPVSGQPMPGPIVTRFSPSTNLGDFDIASLMLARRDGPLDWFVTGSWSKSRPEEGVTGPFGGLMSSPYENPESQTGDMYYLGARYYFNEEKTKVGLEWNKGSKYWFNFAPSQDDIIAPKTSTRGTVWEGYVTHRVSRRFVMKLAYINYNYDYTGSGWHVGAPAELSSTMPAIQGFPTYSKVGKVSLGFSARF